MKSILLASTAVIALAGAAAAEVSFGGSATLGFNNNSTTGNDGFYWGAGMSVTLSQTLDNGLTASATFDLSAFSTSIANSMTATSSSNGGGTGTTSHTHSVALIGNNIAASGLVLSLVAENAGLYFGDTGMAAGKHWASAGDMENDGFSATDGDTVLRGDMAVAGWDASVSYILDTGTGDLAQLSVGASGAFGSVNVAVAYQAEETVYTNASGDWNPDNVFGLSVGTSFSGADVTFAYASNVTDGDNSIGVKVAYPVGPVTLTGYFVSESAGADNWGINAAYANGPIAVALDFQNDQGTELWSLEGSYDVGNGLTVMAGVADSGDDYYVAGAYDLGGGAALLVSYADDQTLDSGDAVGDPEYQNGTTIELSFAF